MEIDVMLCNYAEASPDGKLYITGGGIANSTVQPQGPIVVNLALGATIRVPYTATNQHHRFEMVIAHEDGDLVQATNADGSPAGDLRVTMDFNMGRPPQLTPGGTQTVPLALNMMGLLLPKLGLYTFQLSIDGTETKRLPLTVTALPTGPMFPGTGPTAIP